MRIDLLIYMLKHIYNEKILVFYQAAADAMNQTENIKPENQAQSMEAWMQWAKNCGDKLVDVDHHL